MKLAVVFPGQGTQSLGMLEGWQDLACVRSLLQEADVALGEPFSQCLLEGPQEALNDTRNTQPAVLLASICLFRAIQERLTVPVACFAGHSLGEYSAYVAAGSLNLTDAVQLVRFRAERMCEAVAPGVGSMAAVVGLPSEVVVAACKEASSFGLVEAVNFNSPQQTVIAGENAALAEAMRLCSEAGAKRVLALNVQTPFHTSLMASVVTPLREQLSSLPLCLPVVPVLSNVDACEKTSLKALVDSLAHQAASPVLWTRTAQRMCELGVTHVIECGPGRVLTGLIKKTASTIKTLNVNAWATRDLIESFLQEA